MLILKSKPISGSNGLHRQPTTGVSAHAAASDHVHSMLGQDQLLFMKRGLNMNVTTDQLLDKYGVFKSYLITAVRFCNSSGNLTTAQGSLYTAAAKGGVLIMATTHAFTALTGATLGMDATLSAAARDEITGASNAAVQMYLALTTAQGGAMTADCFVFGIPLTE